MSTKKLDNHPGEHHTFTRPRLYYTASSRSHTTNARGTRSAPEPGTSHQREHHALAMYKQPDHRPADKLPDPWLFDSEALLRELARCRETALQIPITNPNATHFGIQLTVNAIYTLEENLRYLLHLHREQQRSIRRQHEQSLAAALSQSPASHDKIVHLHTPARSNGKTPNNIARPHSKRERFAKRRRASSITPSQVA